MTIAQSAISLPFDSVAEAEIRDLLRLNRARGALERLARYQPRDRAQEIQFFSLRAKSYEHLGQSGTALRDWGRALRRTSTMPQHRTHVRINFSDALLRTGDLARAERVAQRCVAEIRATGGPPEAESTALSTLARILARRGGLGLAARLYERAIELDSDRPMESTWWFRNRINYAHALIRLGEFAGARGVLDQVERSGRMTDPYIVAAHALSGVTLALDAEDFDGAREALARVDEQLIGDHARYRLVWLQYRAALALSAGDAMAALELAEEALEICRGRARDHDDMIAELSRWRADALLELGRHEEALRSARDAVQASEGSDLMDYPAGLRIEGRCLAAMGRLDEARDRFQTALSNLDSTEFVVERRRLYREMEAIGMPLPMARRRPRPPKGLPPSIQRIALDDGRYFVTSDHDLLERIRRAAESRLPVLIEGETGTGKERVARLLHQLGNSARGPFVVVDCTTLSETLAEAELFGVARGAYTGAALDRQGLVGAADGGTLLFDELPQLSLPTQSKLLRLLQEGTYRRLGEARSRSVAVRVVATTNQEPASLLSSGALKPDLFFRLHGYRIYLAPLRDRPGDITLLASEFARQEGLAGFLPEAMVHLENFDWPGNARQLEMMVRVLAAENAPGEWVGESIIQRMLAEAPKLPVPSAEGARLKMALDRHSGNVAATARSLGMSRQGLYKALRRHGLM